MEKFNLKNDIKLFCVTAKSFPDGILEAFQTLEKIHPSVTIRPLYGISYKNRKGKIIYKAGVPEAFDGEGQIYGCESFAIPKGKYLTETIFNFSRNIIAIKNSFQRLLDDPRLDKNSPCVECYKSDKEVLCMVRINELN